MIRRLSAALALVVAPLLASAVVAPAFADRVQVYSIQGADCADCAERVKSELKKAKGVRKVEFGRTRAELTVKLADGVLDSVVIEAVDRAGLEAIVGPGPGAEQNAGYPAGADASVLTFDGASVGPLYKLRVPGKYTVFDVYAAWCLPCATVDDHLKKVVAERPDVAVRKLNVIDFESPLARELGSAFNGLPSVIVFSPDGRRTDIWGAADLERIDKALRPKLVR